MTKRKMTIKSKINGIMFLIPFILIFSCSGGKRTIIREELDSMMDIINKCDTVTYNKLFDKFVLDDIDSEILFCSFIMANKHNYPDAYFNVYFSLTHSSTKGALEKVDKQTQNIALYYLLKSYELGSRKGIYIIKNIYGDSIPNSCDYLDRISKINECIE